MAENHSHDDGIFDDIPEPGVLSGVFTLLGALIGAGLAAYMFFYGPQEAGLASLHTLVAVGIGLLFTLLAMAFTFLIGWILEIAWPLLALLLLISLLIFLPYFFVVQV